MPYYSKENMRERTDAFGAAVSEWNGITRTPLFGSPGFRVFGALFCFLVDDGIVTTKLPESEQTTLMKEGKCTVFRGRDKKVRNWLVFPYRTPGDLKVALPFVRKSYESALLETSDRG